MAVDVAVDVDVCSFEGARWYRGQGEAAHVGSIDWAGLDPNGQPTFIRRIYLAPATQSLPKSIRDACRDEKGHALDFAGNVQALRFVRGLSLTETATATNNDAKCGTEWVATPPAGRMLGFSSPAEAKRWHWGGGGGGMGIIQNESAATRGRRLLLLVSWKEIPFFDRLEVVQAMWAFFCLSAARSNRQVPGFERNQGLK